MCSGRLFAFYNEAGVKSHKSASISLTKTSCVSQSLLSQLEALCWVTFLIHVSQSLSVSWRLYTRCWVTFLIHRARNSTFISSHVRLIARAESHHLHIFWPSFAQPHTSLFCNSRLLSSALSIEREEGKVFWMQSCIVIKIWRQTARDEIHLMAQILYELLLSSIPRANFYEGRGAGKIPTKTNCRKFPLNTTRIMCQKLQFVSSTQQKINLALWPSNQDNDYRVDRVVQMLFYFKLRRACYLLINNCNKWNNFLNL
jgi:hypothetical protein